MPRVLEISRIPLFKYCRPAETTWFSLGHSLIVGDEGCASERFTLRNILRLIRDLRRGAYDLVVLPAVSIGYRHDANLFKRWLRQVVGISASWRLTTALLELVCRWSRNVVVFEHVIDGPDISYEVCALVPGFVAYFKREYDPAAWLRGTPWDAINARVIPWSLFLPDTAVATDATQKTADVFFAGIANSPPRHEGLPRLRALAAEGYRIDIPEERLAYAEYMQRMAQAWLVWSPEGFGWDCYRHYEAAFAGSVPVINRPANSRPRPYEDGVECFYYDPVGDDLERVLKLALEDKERLRAMAVRGREKVLANFTRAAIVASMEAEIAHRQAAMGKHCLVPALAEGVES